MLQWWFNYDYTIATFKAYVFPHAITKCLYAGFTWGTNTKNPIGQDFFNMTPCIDVVKPTQFHSFIKNDANRMDVLNGFFFMIAI